MATVALYRSFRYNFSHAAHEELHGQLIKRKTSASPFAMKVKDEAVTTWLRPQLVTEDLPTGPKPARCGIRFIRV